MAEEIHPLDDPEKKARAVRALLVAAPCMFAGCYLLAWVQGAEVRYAVLIAAVGAVGCAGAALTIHLFGSKSRYALVLFGLISLILRLR